MIESPGSQHAMNEYRLASAPDPIRTSAYGASKTSAASSAAITSICSTASRPISYFAPGWPSEGRVPSDDASSASAAGLMTLAAGLRLMQSSSWMVRFSSTSCCSRTRTPSRDVDPLWAAMRWTTSSVGTQARGVSRGVVIGGDGTAPDRVPPFRVRSRTRDDAQAGQQRQVVRWLLGRGQLLRRRHACTEGVRVRVLDVAVGQCLEVQVRHRERCRCCRRSRSTRRPRPRGSPLPSCRGGRSRTCRRSRLSARRRGRRAGCS